MSIHNGAKTEKPTLNSENKLNLESARYPDSLLQVIRKTGSGGSTDAELLVEGTDYSIVSQTITISNSDKRSGEFEVTYITEDSAKVYFGNENATQLSQQLTGSLLVDAVIDPVSAFETENTYYTGTESAFDLNDKDAIEDPFKNHLIRKSGDEVIHYKGDEVLHYPGEVQRLSLIHI